MKFITLMLFSFMILLSNSHQVMAQAPTLELEKKIAYQQGQFGALYAHCGSVSDRDVIGGTLANWRMETFRGYNGSASDHVVVEQAFDKAASEVMADNNSCQNWIKQAAATWHSVVYLSQYGIPVAAN